MAILHGFGEYPKKYRCVVQPRSMLRDQVWTPAQYPQLSLWLPSVFGCRKYIWRQILRLPENFEAYNSLLEKVPFFSVVFGMDGQLLVSHCR